VIVFLLPSPISIISIEIMERGVHLPMHSPLLVRVTLVQSSRRAETSGSSAAARPNGNRWKKKPKHLSLVYDDCLATERLH